MACGHAWPQLTFSHVRERSWSYCQAPPSQYTRPWRLYSVGICDWWWSRYPKWFSVGEWNWNKVILNMRVPNSPNHLTFTCNMSFLTAHQRRLIIVSFLVLYVIFINSSYFVKPNTFSGFINFSRKCTIWAMYKNKNNHIIAMIGLKIWHVFI